jgi:predicted Na+-dependent transporter
MVSPSHSPDSEQLTLPRLLALFLVPGALMTVVYIVIDPLIETAGFPPIGALLVAILIVLVPFELGVILRKERRASFFQNPDPFAPYRNFFANCVRDVTSSFRNALRR